MMSSDQVGDDTRLGNSRFCLGNFRIYLRNSRFYLGALDLVLGILEFLEIASVALLPRNDGIFGILEFPRYINVKSP